MSPTSKKPSALATKTPTPQRQIRASYTSTTIIVYQAYNNEIADAAISTQRLNASPLYRPARATWIKPSWNWMMYRSGYSYKDINQARILALHMTHDYFISMLQSAVLATESHEKGQGTVIQWDPERGPRLEKRDWRSIQIGLMGDTREEWIKKGIVKIEDVTAKAKELKLVLDNEQDITEDDLIERGLLADEKVFNVPDDVKTRLRMD